MSKVRIRSSSLGEGKALTFDCLGCGHAHSINIGGVEGRPNWQWNGDVDKPVVTPSVFVKTVRLNEANREAYYALDRKELHESIEDVRFRWWCHSFVGTNGALPGQISYLADCSHHLAGKVIDLPEVKRYGYETDSE